MQCHFLKLGTRTSSVLLLSLQWNEITCQIVERSFGSVRWFESILEMNWSISKNSTSCTAIWDQNLWPQQSHKISLKMLEGPMRVWLHTEQHSSHTHAYTHHTPSTAHKYIHTHAYTLKQTHTHHTHIQNHAYKCIHHTHRAQHTHTHTPKAQHTNAHIYTKTHTLRILTCTQINCSAKIHVDKEDWMKIFNQIKHFYSKLTPC